MMEKDVRRKSSFQVARIYLFLLFMVLVSTASSYAQNLIKGVVVDAADIPLPGVSVLVKGTTTGTTTDLDGRYSINVPKNGILVFTYIGMSKQEVKTSGKRTVNVVLQEDVSVLNEVVVVGYGIQKKAHLTGSVASVNSKDLMKSTTSNISQALVGKLPGLMSQQTSGAPGSDNATILVRGRSTYQGDDGPLMLVDGVERPMWQIDPNDVESVTILKDASACAVYGMKASGGVILVTTKRGSEGKASINYKGSLTLSHATTLPKFMNGTQYMQWYNLAKKLDGENPFFTDEDIRNTYNGDPTDGYENTDWLAPLFRTTLMHQHSLSISGGTQKTNYFISGGFMNQNGFIKGHKNQRGHFRSNLDTKPVKGLSVSLNLAGRVEDYNQPGANTYENQMSNNVVGSLLYAAPFVPMELEGYPTSGYRGGTNPLYAAEHSGFKTKRNVAFETSAKAEYEFPFLKGLKAGMFMSWDWQDIDSKSMSYAYKLMYYDHPSKSYILQNASWLNEEGELSQSDMKLQKLLVRPSVTYNNTFGKHTVGALFLYEMSKSNTKAMSAARSKFPLLDIPELDFGSDIHPKNGNGGYYNKTAYAGYVGRLNYAYANKYLAEFTFRYDGSYKFAKDNRWGFFPSVSLGYVMSEESFFKELLPKVDYFKLRGSVGLLGSDNVDPFLYRRKYDWTVNGAVFGSNPTTQNTLYNSVTYPMEELTWEKCRSINFGFDLSAWRGLLGIEFDVFYKYTYDILRPISGAYPSSLGGHYPSIENSGALDNRGFELTLKHSNRVGQVSYNLNGNLSFARNRILRMTQGDGTLPWKNKLGTSVGAVWGYKSLGLFQTQEELDNAPISSNPIRLGDIKYADIDGDGRLTWNDEVKIARSTMPEMMFSLTGDAQWKGFDISVQLQGAALCDKMLQQEWYNGVRDQTPLTRPWYAGWDNAPLFLVENSWRPDFTNAEYPRLSTVASSNSSEISDFWKRNGAYLRLKNVTLGYTFPKKWMKKAGVNNLRIFASGFNLLTFTAFKYLDPESSNVIQGYYPQQRTFTFGLDVTF